MLNRVEERCRKTPKRALLRQWGKSNFACRESGGKLDDMKHSHEIEYRIHGDDLQDGRDRIGSTGNVVAEAGAMNWMEEDICFRSQNGGWQ